MGRLLLKESRAPASRYSIPAQDWPRHLSFALFLVAFATVWIQVVLISEPPTSTPYWQAALLLLAVAATFTDLARQLPAQNVFLAVFVILVIGGAVQAVGALTGIPFGPFLFGERLGPRLFHPLPWAAPLIWVVALLNSRGVARLMMRPWRRMRTYGFWVIGLTAAVTAIFDFGLEPFAARVQHYWIWNPTKIGFDYYGAPFICFISWAIVSVLILAFITPALINKRPGKTPPSFQPLILWLLLQVLFASADAAHGLWIAVIGTAVVTLPVTVFAVRGGTW